MPTLTMLGLGFRVWDLGFSVQALGFRGQFSGLRVIERKTIEPRWVYYLNTGVLGLHKDRLGLCGYGRTPTIQTLTLRLRI